MNSSKLVAGQTFPDITLALLGGGEINLTAVPAEGCDWRMVVVYRGKHCPICTQYLSTLNELLPEFKKLGVDVVAVSADPIEKAMAQMELVKPLFDVAYGLSIEQMQKIGVYISNPRSPEETDRPFAEPGLFIINDKKQAQIIDISNVPFSRPELKSMIMGLGFIRNPQNNYPIRGTYK
ncbi:MULTISPECIES: peroxiredoxin-like family protein [unclassified Shewanella]|jgi:peroxiredoxin|uniref:peroxiredoxin-like family protein n=1 Tax=unclassified Shewanella TaxID=196818 RepID=UPI00137C221F|nr:peroxiredoxin-like family protein [Shewanella sp. Arc9-LZ]QHS13334.1 AhpC/TSA family protein [Shewanella sp. Arc9-LZ]|tara:strand:+ start:6243 stop:6779 length:537 start_codon:yes stop_codon:yes gene_type:complete